MGPELEMGAYHGTPEPTSPYLAEVEADCQRNMPYAFDRLQAKRLNGGAVHFRRIDGPAEITFSHQLSEAGARELDAFLRNLLAREPAARQRELSEFAAAQRMMADKATRPAEAGGAG